MNADSDDLAEALDLDRDVVCIHSSMRSLKPRIEASSIIESFLNRGCTIVVPTFTYFHEVDPPSDDHPSGNGMDYSKADSELPVRQPAFDREKNKLSVHDMGSFPAALLNMNNRVRGNHPLNSFSAIGDRADELITGQSWEDVYAPLRKLVEMKGKLLVMGTDLTSLTFIHYAEQLAGRKLFVRWAKDVANCTQRVRVGSCSRAFNNLQLSLDHLCVDISYRQSRCQLLPAIETLDSLVTSIRSNPKITHCKDTMCLRCNSAVLGGPEV